MKHELQNDFYDNAYSLDNKYKEHYSKSPYLKIWQSIIPNIKSIADFGCGVGQFAEMCLDNGVHYAYGVDFSEVAIRECRRLDAGFYLRNLLENCYEYHDYTTAVFLETLEHIEDDLNVLGSIPQGKKVIISVPNWDSISHVRHFSCITDAVDRYNDIIKITNVETFPIGKEGKEIYVIYGNKDK